MKKTKSWSLLASWVTGTLMVFWFSACGREDPGPSAGRSAPEVRVVEMKTETVATERTWFGVWEPLRSVEMRAPESGEVTSVDCDQGDLVQRGERLVVIEGTEFQARESVLERRLFLVKENLERWRELFQAGAAGPSEVENAEREYLEVEEQLAALQARIVAAELRSPVDGVVTELRVAPGTRVSGGDPLLRIQDKSALGIRLQVAARESRYLEDRESIRVESQGGDLHEIARMVSIEDPQAPRGYLTYEIFIHDPPESGSREIKVIHRAERSAILAPWTAVAREGDAHWVAVVGGDPTVVNRQEVRLGEGQANGIEILDGLAEGDRILRFEPRSQPEGAEVQARVDGESA